MLIRNSMSSGSHGPALPELHKRLRWVALAGIAVFALLVGRLWQLQVMRGESYFERTVSNVVKERYLPSVRGQILDRKGLPLAANRPAFNVYVTPKTLTPELVAEVDEHATTVPMRTSLAPQAGRITRSYRRRAPFDTGVSPARYLGGGRPPAG